MDNSKRMPFDLRAALPLILPKATAWAAAVSEAILQTGHPLDEAQMDLARRVGVEQPGRIRIATVDTMPLPEDMSLQQAALATGLLGPGTIGLTLGYGVMVQSGRANNRLLAHEFRHVHQYERAGSIAAFLTEYLAQVAAFGYRDAPLEVDARAQELCNVGSITD